MEEVSKIFLISTYKSLYNLYKLSFEIASALVLWQRAMDQMPHVVQAFSAIWMISLSLAK